MPGESDRSNREHNFRLLKQSSCRVHESILWASKVKTFSDCDDKASADGVREIRKVSEAG